MGVLSSIFPNHDLYCPMCHEWSDADDWYEVDNESVGCPTCDTVNGPHDSPLYSRSKSTSKMAEALQKQYERHEPKQQIAARHRCMSRYSTFIVDNSGRAKLFVEGKDLI